MASIQQIITKGDKLMTKEENSLIRSARTSESYVYDALMEIFKNVDITNGKISSSSKADEFLASLDARIFGALKESGYGDSVQSFVNSYSAISSNVVDLHQALGNGLIPAKDINLIQRLEVNKTIANLTQQGMYSSFIAPVREGLYRNIVLGATVADTEKLITDLVISNTEKESPLTRYVGQVANDSIRQFDGSINQVAKIGLNLNATQYVGSIIQDSRAQCMKWVSMAIIKDDQLAAEIDFALNKGTYSNKRCSGMIPGTNTINFCVNRGGYRCRHRAIPIRFRNPK